MTLCQVDKSYKKTPRQESKVKAQLDLKDVQRSGVKNVPTSIVQPPLVLKKMGVYIMQCTIEAITICEVLGGMHWGNLFLKALNVDTSSITYKYLSAHKNHFSPCFLSSFFYWPLLHIFFMTSNTPDCSPLGALMKLHLTHNS